jgi:hypothetical protein
MTDRDRARWGAIFFVPILPSVRTGCGKIFFGKKTVTIPSAVGCQGKYLRCSVFDHVATPKNRRYIALSLGDKGTARHRAANLGPAIT